MQEAVVSHSLLDWMIGSLSNVAGTFLSYSTVVGFLLADLQRSRTLSPQRKPVRHVSLELTTLPHRYAYTSPLGIRKVRHASVDEVSFNCISEDCHHQHHTSMPSVHELKIYFESLSQIEDRGLTLRGMSLQITSVRLNRIYLSGSDWLLSSLKASLCPDDVVTIIDVSTTLPYNTYKSVYVCVCVLQSSPGHICLASRLAAVLMIQLQ